MTSYDCSKCGREFDTKNGRGVHKSLADHSKPWNNREALYEAYIERGMGQKEIAEAWGTSPQNISKCMEEFGIKARDVDEQLRGRRDKKATYSMGLSGYARWIAGNGGESTDKYYVHRLLAIAEYGVEAVVGNHVHHKNGVRWDNRPDNLEVLSSSDHARAHGKLDFEEREKLAKEYISSDKTYQDVADEFGVGKRTANEYIRQYREGELIQQ